MAKATALIVVPTLFTDDLRPNLPISLDPEGTKAKLDEFLANGYRIKLMNDFVYNNAVFTHYVLEKE